MGTTQARDATELAHVQGAQAAAEQPESSLPAELDGPPAEQSTEQPDDSAGDQGATETDGTPGSDAGEVGQLRGRSPLIDNDHVGNAIVHHSQTCNSLLEQNDAKTRPPIDKRFVHTGEASTSHHVPPQERAPLAADHTLVGSVGSPHLATRPAKRAKRSNAGGSPSNLLTAQLFREGCICIQTGYCVQRLLIIFVLL